MKFAGIGASPGVGVGPIHRLEREELAVRDTPVFADAVERVFMPPSTPLAPTSPASATASRAN
jgi:hypothetical protein